jgi:uncharacterized protein
VQKFALSIDNIPALLWGNQSDKLFIAVHGSQASKSDDIIALFAEAASIKGYMTISFDLPEHGDRKTDPTPCKAFNCVDDLKTIMSYAKTISNDIRLFTCSMGTYFSLLAYHTESIRQALFLSPVVDMERIIQNMMTWFSISKEQLKSEQKVETPIGQTLYWDYYSYVRENPISHWMIPTEILYGSGDNLCEPEVVSEFAKRYCCNLTVMDKGEHYFHTQEQLTFFKKWLNEVIEKD